MHLQEIPVISFILHINKNKKKGGGVIRRVGPNVGLLQHNQECKFFTSRIRSVNECHILEVECTSWKYCHKTQNDHCVE